MWAWAVSSEPESYERGDNVIIMGDRRIYHGQYTRMLLYEGGLGGVNKTEGVGEQQFCPGLMADRDCDEGKAARSQISLAQAPKVRSLARPVSRV